MVRADSKYRNHDLDDWVAEHGWYKIEVVQKGPGQEGFVLLPKRWVVERTFAWLGRCRIHSRDYEGLTESSEAQVRISMIQLMLRRLTGGDIETLTDMSDRRKSRLHRASGTDS